MLLTSYTVHCISQHYVTNWPPDAIPALERINKLKREEARTRGPRSLKEKSAADPYIGYLVQSSSTAFKPPVNDSTESYLWAVRQILESSSCTFSYPRSYVLNSR
jgi:hypothetical protein